MTKKNLPLSPASIELQPPSSSDSSRTLVLQPRPGGVVTVIIRERTMLGNEEMVATTVLLSELVDAVTSMDEGAGQ